MKYATSEKNGSRGTLGNQYLRFGTLKLDINAGERRGEPKNCFFANKKGPKQCLGFKYFFLALTVLDTPLRERKY